MNFTKKILALLLVAIMVAMSFTACSPKGDALMSVGDSEMSVNLFKLYLSRAKGTLSSAYNFGATALEDEFWDTIVDAENLTTYNDLYTQMVLDNAKSHLAAVALFEERGLELPESYIAEIDEEMELMLDIDADGSKTVFNAKIADFGVNYEMLREAYIIEAKIAYLKEDIFGTNGSKIAAERIDEYYQKTYARYKHVFFYTFENVYEQDENGDDIYYEEDGTISYQTVSTDERTVTAKKNEDGSYAKDVNEEDIWVYIDENGKERIAYNKVKGSRKNVTDADGPVTKDYDTEKMKEILDKANGILEQTKKGDTIGFDLLVKEYNEDVGRDDGYYITESTTGDFPEVTKKVFEMEIGETAIVQSEYGIHVVMRYDLEDGAYGMEEYEEFFISNETGTYVFMSDLTNNLFNTYISTLKDNIKIDESLIEGVDMKSAKANYYY